MNQTISSHLALQGRVILHEPTGETTGLTYSQHAGLESFAEDAQLANHILQSCRSRLGLLKKAARGPDPLKAAHVRVVVDDLLVELNDGGVLPSYLERTAELFENAEPLPSLVNPCSGNSPSLHLVTDGTA